MFDKADRKMSREVRGTPLIPWTMDNMRKCLPVKLRQTYTS